VCFFFLTSASPPLKNATKEQIPSLKTVNFVSKINMLTAWSPDPEVCVKTDSSSRYVDFHDNFD
jgi:hypothetical protein